MLLLPPLPPMPPLLLPRKAVTRRIGSIRLPTRHNPYGGRARCDDADDDADSAPPPGPPHAGTTRTPTSVRATPASACYLSPPRGLPRPHRPRRRCRTRRPRLRVERSNHCATIIVKRRFTRVPAVAAGSVSRVEPSHRRRLLVLVLRVLELQVPVLSRAVAALRISKRRHQSHARGWRPEHCFANVGILNKHIST